MYVHISYFTYLRAKGVFATFFKSIRPPFSKETIETNVEFVALTLVSEPYLTLKLDWGLDTHHVLGSSMGVIYPSIEPKNLRERGNPWKSMGWI